MKLKTIALSLALTLSATSGWAQYAGGFSLAPARYDQPVRTQPAPEPRTCLGDIQHAISTASAIELVPTILVSACLTPTALIAAIFGE